MLFQKKATPPSLDLNLVVGLGNIGNQYVNTRHNIGFEVVDELARQYHTSFRKGKFHGEEATVTIDGRRVLLLKPHTLMNLSGDAVSAAVRFYKIPLERVLVVCDDVNLPPGKIRLRARGSDGGHNGLWHIINRLGRQDFPRLRVGVGAKPPFMDLAVYVLGRFLSSERSIMDTARDNSVNAIEDWVRNGIDAAMNKWNQAS